MAGTRRISNRWRGTQRTTHSAFAVFSRQVLVQLMIGVGSVYGVECSDPCASEIQVFDGPPAEHQLEQLPGTLRGHLPPAEPTTSLSPVSESRTLAQQLRAGAFGFSRLVLVQRHHVESSHVYRIWQMTR
jgi:hypothetical protein